MHAEYASDGRTAIFDGIRFRKDMKTGYFLAGKATHNGKRERLHCYVWRYYNGEIPDGYHVHHIDEDKNRNDIDNLACIPQFCHLSLHATEHAKSNYDAVIANLNEKARPKASAWHGSEAGRKWHRERYRDSLGTIEPKEHICQYCGKVYMSKKNDSKFCSNSCKAAARRKSGVDNETRMCVICGKEFECNKYSLRKCCSDKCGAELRWDNEHKAMRQTASVQHGG